MDDRTQNFDLHEKDINGYIYILKIIHMVSMDTYTISIYQESRKDTSLDWNKPPQATVEASGGGEGARDCH